jgi:hypothetical protein
MDFDDFKFAPEIDDNNSTNGHNGKSVCFKRFLMIRQPIQLISISPWIFTIKIDTMINTIKIATTPILTWKINTKIIILTLQSKI